MKNNQEKTKQQAHGNHDKQRRKSHQQRQLTESKRPWDLSRFEGVMVSTLKLGSKDPSSTLGRTFSQLILDDVDYS